MKFSIITPTHNLKYIPELYESIISQTYENWEWILYLNNNAVDHYLELPSELLRHPNIKIHIEPSHDTRVGYLKNKAFHLGSGDVLVEADHDDILTNNCLQRLFDVYSINDDVGFVYSDNAKLQMNGNFIPYNPSVGWTHEMFKYNNSELYHMHSFDPTSQAMSFIWYEPDHVRSWRTEIYKELGGHNIEYDVLDDQELMIRTYLLTKFVRIPEALYIYRITGDNTWLERNTRIQTETIQLYYKYAYKLAERDADLNGLLKIDITESQDKTDGYLKLGKSGDFSCDLSNGIPINDNKVGVIKVDNILHQVNNPIRLMSEIYRVLVDFGWALIKIKNVNHIPNWNQKSLLYYTEKEHANMIKNDKIRFQSYRHEIENGLDLHAYLSAIKSDKKRPHSIKI